MNRIAAVNKEKHEFALFVESLSSLIQRTIPGQEFIISDEKLFHRIMTVLRLRIDDSCVVFDQKIHALCTITALSGKKQIHMIMQSKQLTTALRPNITFLLPLLKRDDYEGALYSLAEIGVNTIQLVSTQKTHTSWSDERDGDRARRILIAAAEQSKNYAIPELKAPIALDKALQTMSNGLTKVFFDPLGERFFSVMSALYDNQPDHIVLLIGPEGDLSSEEKKIVKEKGFIFCALTPTIVRAVQAAALGAGLVRSLFIPPCF
jgi:16S rRNA (uracil1498-N3)-methyltransferase